MASMTSTANTASTANTTSTANLSQPITLTCHGPRLDPDSADQAPLLVEVCQGQLVGQLAGEVARALGYGLDAAGAEAAGAEASTPSETRARSWTFAKGGFVLNPADELIRFLEDGDHVDLIRL